MVGTTAVRHAGKPFRVMGALNGAEATTVVSADLRTTHPPTMSY
jgi:hypothetical protein